MVETNLQHDSVAETKERARELSNKQQLRRRGETAAKGRRRRTWRRNLRRSEFVEPEFVLFLFDFEMVDNIGAFVYKYPEDEWFDARVNMHCRVSDLSILKEVMKRKGMLRRWEHGVFGQFIGMGKGKQFFSGKLCHLLLCREVVYPYGRADEMWFRVGGQTIRFGKEEFLLLTGLKFGSLPKGVVTQSISTPGNVHHRYFHGLPTHIEDIIHKLREVQQFELEDDVLKLGYVFFLCHILLGRDYRRIVPNWLWGMVEDVIAFEAFPWGTYIYSLTIYWLGKALKGRIDKRTQNRQQNGDSSKSQDIGYNVYGFPWAFMYWAMEAIPKLTGVVGVRRGDGFPRVRRWYCRKKPPNLQKEFTDELEAHVTLTPSDEERRQAYYLHFDPDQFVGPLTHKVGGLGDDSEDEGPNVRGRRCRAPMGRGRGRSRRDRGHLQMIPPNTSQSVQPTHSVATTSSDSEAMVEGIRSEQRSKRRQDGSHNIANVRSFDSGHSRSIPEPRPFGTEFPTTSSDSESMVEGIRSEQRSKRGHDGSHNTATVRSFNSGHSRSIPEPRSFGIEFPTIDPPCHTPSRSFPHFSFQVPRSEFEDRIHQLEMAMKEEVQAAENRINLKLSMIHDDICAKFADVPRTTNGFEATCDASSFRATNGFEDHVHTSAMPNFTPPVADRAEEPDIADRAEEPDIADKAEESDKHRHIVEESITDKLNGKRVRRPSAAIRTPYTVPRHVKEIVYARKKGTKGKPNDNVDFGQ